MFYRIPSDSTRKPLDLFLRAFMSINVHIYLRLRGQDTIKAFIYK